MATEAATKADSTFVGTNNPRAEKRSPRVDATEVRIANMTKANVIGTTTLAATASPDVAEMAPAGISQRRLTHDVTPSPTQWTHVQGDFQQRVNAKAHTPARASDAVGPDDAVRIAQIGSPIEIMRLG